MLPFLWPFRTGRPPHVARNVAGDKDSIEGASQQITMFKPFGDGRTNAHPHLYSTYTGAGKLFIACVNICLRKLPEDWTLCNRVTGACDESASLPALRANLPHELADFMHVPGEGEGGDIDAVLRKVWKVNV